MSEETDLSGNGQSSGAAACSAGQRYTVVHDMPGYSVSDERGDLFPTLNGNRKYRLLSMHGCDYETAEKIAIALNVLDLTILEHKLYERGDKQAAKECRERVYDLCFRQHGKGVQVV